MSNQSMTAADLAIFNSELAARMVPQFKKAAHKTEAGDVVYVFGSDDLATKGKRWVGFNFIKPQYTAGMVGCRLEFKFMRSRGKAPKAVAFSQDGTRNEDVDWVNFETSLIAIQDMIDQELIDARLGQALMRWAEVRAVESSELPSTDKADKINLISAIGFEQEAIVTLRLVRTPQGDLARNPIGLDSFSLTGFILQGQSRAVQKPGKPVLAKVGRGKKAAAPAAVELETDNIPF
ncbi:hypothetical protein ACQ4M3_19185 [Leptolyngbya sp. AN03gr2]|uniref:hypothetical protein n=1 Tax=Leptolyngbya sp. AN03gr2 TaxID=3423364 RepID=UPI003D310B75